jgi:hypothetical protein
MKKGTKVSGTKPRSGFADPAVEAAFDAYPKPLKPKLLALRRLILDTARTTSGVGALEETLKWGQPSYLTPETKSGSTIRIDAIKSGPTDTRSTSTARPIWSKRSANCTRVSSAMAATAASS